MNYQYQLNNNLSASHFSALFVMPCNQWVSQNAEVWSPFSAPSLSPLDNNEKIPFQYSGTSNVASFHQSNKQQLPTPISKPKFNRAIDSTAQKNQLLHAMQNKFKGSRNSEMKKLPKRSENIDLSDYLRKALEQKAAGRTKMCTFCKSNGEAEHIYTSHALKNSINKITCPILMQYSCVECGATGENTHTIKYCPVMQRKSRMQMLNNIRIAPQ